MSSNKKLTFAFLLTGGIIALPALADIETTTVKTTDIPVPGGTETTTVKTTTVPVIGGSQTTTTRTTSNSAFPSTLAGVTTTSVPYVLPGSESYFVIDPVTGSVVGNYDATTGLADASLLRPGLVIISKGSGRVIAAVDATGRPIELTVAPALDPFVLAIDTRRAKIDALIADCLSRGTMDAAEAAALRKELHRIETEELVAKQSTGVLTYSRALQIAVDLNDLETRLKPFMPQSDVVPLVGARMISTNGQLVVVSDIEYRQAKLLQRIDDEYSAGRLSAQQVSNLKDQLNSIAALKSKYMKNGELSESNKAKISSKLDTVTTRLNEDVAEINAKRSKMGLKVN